MSPRRSDPLMRVTLLEAGARLLAEEGPCALSTRRLAATVGTSTTAVYTHFGGMEDLIRAMVREGFARLDRALAAVATTADPVADAVVLGYAYRENARENPHLYSVMFGGSALGGFALTDDDRQHGRYTLESLVDAVRRAMAAGRFHGSDPSFIAEQMWIAVHGLATLELGGYLVAPYDPDTSYRGQLETLLIGAGDAPAEAATSMKIGTQRYLLAREFFM
ncbi:TetR/AcrR family transcriptional regulator [Nocardia terpenica]|uniref:TetR family transcriptional regulator n=2 Tax=Nocardia terpenica TaxID=455432 RepID=A0A291RJI2_9NOCA|nr:TetR family transcriptional regulator [Nocardia terpenica]